MAMSNKLVVVIAMIVSLNGNAAFTKTRTRQCAAQRPLSKLETPRHYFVIVQPPKPPNILRSKLDGVDDVFLLSIDGTLATTSRSRSFMAICVAMKVWPSLISNMEALGMSHEALFCLENITEVGCRNFEDDQHEWLLQKLSALSSITQQGNDPDAMMGCDEVLMVRLLLEEQLLDGGRSNGRGGKYGGKFHPSTTATITTKSSSSSSSLSVDGQGKSVVGSRPLTVGELYANWSELRDVTRMKYPFIEKDLNGKEKRLDPLPYIRQYMREISSTTHQRHAWRSLAWDVLFDCQSDFNDGNGGHMKLRHNTMLLLGHNTHVSSTLKSLSLLGCKFDVETDFNTSLAGSEGMLDGFTTNNHDHSKDFTKMKVIVTTSEKAQKRLGHGLMLVVPDAQTGETHSSMIERIVFDFCERSHMTKNICVIHSSLEVLEQCKPFLGEDA